MGMEEVFDFDGETFSPPTMITSFFLVHDIVKPSSSCLAMSPYRAIHPSRLAPWLRFL